MSEPPRHRFRAGAGWLAALPWIGGLLAVVVVALAGQWLGQEEPSPRSSPSIAPPSPLVALLRPSAGSTWFGDGLLPVEGRARAGSTVLHFVVTAGGHEIGSIDIEPDDQGSFSTVVPILPPIDGGPATLSVRSGSSPEPLASVDIGFEPAHPLVLWVPLPAMTLDGETLAVVGFARPPVQSVRIELEWPHASKIADETRVPKSNPVTAPWRRFDLSLPLPTERDRGCVLFHASALDKGGEKLWGLEMALDLAGADPSTRCFVGVSGWPSSEGFRLPAPTDTGSCRAPDPAGSSRDSTGACRSCQESSESGTVHGHLSDDGLGRGSGLNAFDRLHPPSVDRLGEAVRLSLGDDDVGVVEEPVDRGGGESFREETLEARSCSIDEPSTPGHARGYAIRERTPSIIRSRAIRVRTYRRRVALRERRGERRREDVDLSRPVPDTTGRSATCRLAPSAC